MQRNERDPASARTPAPDTPGGPAERARLRVTCRRQAALIDTMSRALTTLGDGAHALKAENNELRAAIDRVSAAAPDPWDLDAPAAGELIEQRLRLDAGAPHAARGLLADVFGERLNSAALERAQLVLSELVTNSVRHSGAHPDSGVVVRLRRRRGGVWLEVEDSGRAAVASGDRTAGGGFGLGIVHALSERWRFEHTATVGTRVSAELRDAPPSGAAHSGRADLTRSSVESRGAAADRQRRHAGVASGDVRDLHVVPEPRAATWRVYDGDSVTPASEHTTETDAEAAAQWLARAGGAARVVIHDRYHRTHLSAVQESEAP